MPQAPHRLAGASWLIGCTTRPLQCPFHMPLPEMRRPPAVAFFCRAMWPRLRRKLKPAASNDSPTHPRDRHAVQRPATHLDGPRSIPSPRRCTTFRSGRGCLLIKPSCIGASTEALRENVSINCGLMGWDNPVLSISSIRHEKKLRHFSTYSKILRKDTARGGAPTGLLLSTGGGVLGKTRITC